jgi:hypothetical protein
MLNMRLKYKIINIRPKLKKNIFISYFLKVIYPYRLGLWKKLDDDHLVLVPLQM